MSEWEEEENFGSEAEEDQENGCDYGVSEFCSDPPTKDMGLCTSECQEYLESVKAEAGPDTSIWVCRECGCTDSSPCIKNLPGAAIETCHWEEENLCSFCAEKIKQRKKS